VTGLRVLIEAAREAVEEGTFDARVDRHLSCLTLGLDPQGWKEANGLGEATERIRATFGLLGFESPA
jgi:hypothetical protein